jgi:hypothetical protein
MRVRPMKAAQRGLNSFGALLVIVVAVVAAYYVYQGVTGEDEVPTCDTQFESCMKLCRRTSTDNDSMQACQKKCESDVEFCKMAARRNQGK